MRKLLATTDLGQRSVKQILMEELNVALNMTQKQRFQSYNLVGHSKMITCMDIKQGLLVTGSVDCQVKVWDIKRKKGVTVGSRGAHINQVT